jgi:hypothetical protein
MDVQALQGGHNIEIYPNGRCLITRIAPGNRKESELMFETILPAEELERLLRLARESGFFQFKPKQKTGMPDEARPRIRISIQGSATFEAAKWEGEVNERFDPLYKALLAVAESRKPVRILHSNHR